MYKDWYVYIMSNRKDGVLYIGMTSNLNARVQQHKNKFDSKSFTHQYNLTHLVYFEHLTSFEEAVLRENRLKNWKRSWKLDLIKKQNPEWQDLYLQF